MNTCYWRTLRPRILNYSEPLLKKKEKCDRGSVPRKAADGFLTGRLHSGDGGTNPTRAGSFTVRGELISWLVLSFSESSLNA